MGIGTWQALGESDSTIPRRLDRTVFAGLLGAVVPVECKAGQHEGCQSGAQSREEAIDCACM